MGEGQEVLAVIKDWWKSQWIPHSNVRPFHKFDNEKGWFMLFSPAGIIRVKAMPKTAPSFRDTYLNRFEGIKDNKDYFALYEAIKKDKQLRVSYSANIRTRLEGFVRSVL